MPRERSEREKEANKLRMQRIGADPEYRARRAKYIKERKARRKYWLNKYREARGCDHCGFKGPYVCYDWHHEGGKELEIASSYTLSLKRLFAELRKCIVLCANCHRIEHMKEREESYCGS